MNSEYAFVYWLMLVIGLSVLVLMSKDNAPSATSVVGIIVAAGFFATLFALGDIGAALLMKGSQ